MPRERPDDPEARTSGAAPLALAERIHELMEAVGAPPAPDGVRAADALRRLGRWLVAAPASAAEVAALAQALEAVERGLPARETRSRYAVPGALAGRLAEQAGFHPNARSTHPLVGRANPLAPPIELRAEGDRVLGRLRFGPLHEGMPDCAHGGWIASGFDIVFAQAATRAPAGGGVTGTLTVRYRGLTPIEAPLCYEAWFERSEGRKIFVRGHLRTDPGGGPDAAAEARITAEAEGIFVTRGDRDPDAAGPRRGPGPPRAGGTTRG